MSAILIPLQIVLSILLLFCILLQHRASGLSATFGGSGAAPIQRRGAERVIYRAAIWLSVAFFALPVVQWFLA